MSYALLVVLVFMGGTTTGCRAFQVPYSFHVRPYAALRCESEEHLPGSDVLDTHDLLEGIGEMEDDAMPAEMRARILEEGGANEWDMKLDDGLHAPDQLGFCAGSREPHAQHGAVHWLGGGSGPWAVVTFRERWRPSQDGHHCRLPGMHPSGTARPSRPSFSTGRNTCLRTSHASGVECGVLTVEYE